VIRQFSTLLEEAKARLLSQDKSERLKLRAESEKARGLLSQPGWEDLILPFMEQAEETAVRLVLRQPGASDTQEFFKGYAAALNDLKNFIGGIADEDNRILREERDEYEARLREEELPGRFRRFG
jgi:hypothetical protein